MIRLVLEKMCSFKFVHQHYFCDTYFGQISKKISEIIRENRSVSGNKITESGICQMSGRIQTKFSFQVGSAHIHMRVEPFGFQLGSAHIHMRPCVIVCAYLQ